MATRTRPATTDPDQAREPLEPQHLQTAFEVRWPNRPGPVPPEAVAEIAEVAQLLRASLDDKRHKPTSLRLNQSLWQAADAAVRQGWAPSLTALVEQCLSVVLTRITEDAEEEAAFEEHYRLHPELRPEPWELAVAGAQIDGNPVADHPDLIRRAVAELGETTDIDTILAWASGALAASAR